MVLLPFIKSIYAFFGVGLKQVRGGARRNDHVFEVRFSGLGMKERGWV